MISKKRGGGGVLFTFLLVMTFCLASDKSSAQVDAHFSQYYAYPLWLNPGLTGRIDGSFRVSANFKSQWASIAAPYQTMALSFDTHAFNHLSLGITVMNQTAGDAGYQYLNVLGSVAYEVVFDENSDHSLSIGVQSGIINRRIDPAQFRSGNQWNPILGFDPTIPNGEKISRTSILGLDANVGIFYTNRSEYTHFQPFVGMSLYHLSRPSISFLTGSDDRLPMRLNIHGGVRMEVNNRFSLTPHFLYLRQGEVDEKVGGLYGQYSLNNQLDFILGTTLRYNDAIIPYIGILFNNFNLGLSYDVNISDLAVASMNNGGIELSLSFVRHQKSSSSIQLSCPRF